jgi:hypothetical protein
MAWSSSMQIVLIAQPRVLASAEVAACALTCLAKRLYHSNDSRRRSQALICKAKQEAQFLKPSGRCHRPYRFQSSVFSQNT